MTFDSPADQLCLGGELFFLWFLVSTPHLSKCLAVHAFVTKWSNSRKEFPSYIHLINSHAPLAQVRDG